MSSKNAQITGWFGYKKEGGQTTVTITGSDFGSIPGSVKLIGQGVGAIRAQIVSWSETSIVAIAPDDVTIMRVMVYAVNERGQEKTASITPPTETRATNTPDPTWTVDTVDDTEDAIIITGTDLADVVDVFAYDASVPQKIALAPSAMDGDALIVVWPDNFTAPIRTLILSDGNGGNVSEITEDLVPAPNGIISDVATVAINSTSVVSIIGSGFGTDQGSVKLIRDGGVEEPVNVLSNGWSDSVVQVAATPATTYESVELTRADDEVAALSASFPANFISASVSTGVPVITSIAQVGDHIEITGNELLLLGYSFFHLAVSSDGVAPTDTQYLFMYDGSTFCDQLIERSDTLVRFRANNIIFGERRGLDDFYIHSVGAWPDGVYSGPFVAEHTPAAPVHVTWDPIDEEALPVITDVDATGWLVTLTGENFDAIPRDSYGGLTLSGGGKSINFTVPAVVPDPLGRFTSVTDTEIKFYADTFYNGFDTIEDAAAFNNLCTYRTHVLGAPINLPG